MDVDMTDKSTKFFLYLTHHRSFQFLLEATLTRYVMAAILDFQDDRYRKTWNDKYLGL